MRKEVRNMRAINRLILTGETSEKVYPWLACSEDYAEVYIRHFNGGMTAEKLQGILRTFGDHVHGMLDEEVEPLRAIENEYLILSYQKV